MRFRLDFNITPGQYWQNTREFVFQVMEVTNEYVELQPEDDDAKPIKINPYDLPRRYTLVSGS